MNDHNEQPTPPLAKVPLERIGVAGLWCRDSQVLLTRRAPGIPYGNLWCFPGGGIDPGETEEAALQREWQEELGTPVRLIRKIGSSETSNGRFLLHWYIVEGLSDQFRPNPAEVAEIRWVDLKDLPNMPDLLGSNRKLIQSLSADQLLASPTTTVWQDLQEHLETLRRTDMYRTLRPLTSPVGRTIRLQDGPEALNFASNDYLSLAADPRVTAAAKEALNTWGWGAGASRLVSGNTTVHDALESVLASFKGAEAATVLPTGYMANLAAIRTLAGPHDVIFLDKLNHASIIDAASSSGAQIRVFPHRNYSRLEALLQRYASARRRLIVTDTVFSMDGDLADLPELVRLKRRYNAILIVDEAHATGVLGPQGRGLAELQGVESEIDVTVGTLSKALGGIGGFISGPRILREAIINLARPLIFTTAIPAAACAAAIRALEIVHEEPWRRTRALDLATQLRKRLTQAGWNCGDSQTQIVPLLVGQPDRAVALSTRLLNVGFLAPAIRPPAVPPGTSRLRISITAAHTIEDITGLAEAIGHREP